MSEITLRPTVGQAELLVQTMRLGLALYAGSKPHVTEAHKEVKRILDREKIDDVEDLLRDMLNSVEVVRSNKGKPLVEDTREVVQLTLSQNGVAFVARLINFFNASIEGDFVEQLGQFNSLLHMLQIHRSSVEAVSRQVNAIVTAKGWTSCSDGVEG